MTADESCTMALITAMAPSEEVDIASLAVAHSATLYKVAHAILRDPDGARDVVQDVFVRVLKHRSRLNSISDHRVWLVRIAWNLALDRKKRKRADQMDARFADQIVANQPAAERMLEDAQRYQIVLTAIDRLPKLEKQALLLATVEEIGIEEISRVMERTESAVRGLVHRARARLQRELEATI